MTTAVRLSSLPNSKARLGRSQLNKGMVHLCHFDRFCNLEFCTWEGRTMYEFTIYTFFWLSCEPDESVSSQVSSFVLWAYTDGLWGDEREEGGSLLTSMGCHGGASSSLSTSQIPSQARTRNLSYKNGKSDAACLKGTLAFSPYLVDMDKENQPKHLELIGW